MYLLELNVSKVLTSRPEVLGPFHKDEIGEIINYPLVGHWEVRQYQNLQIRVNYLPLETASAYKV